MEGNYVKGIVPPLRGLFFQPGFRVWGAYAPPL